MRPPESGHLIGTWGLNAIFLLRSWSDVRLLTRYPNNEGGFRLTRKKGVYSLRLVVSQSSSERKVSLEMRRTTQFGKDKMLSVTRPPQLGELRLMLESGHILHFSDQRDTMSCAAALDKALRLVDLQVAPCLTALLRSNPEQLPVKKKRACLNMNDVEVQRYVASLLIDPDFHDFVHDIGVFYSKIRKSIPAASDAHLVAPNSFDLGQPRSLLQDRAV